ncbi:hypothetical protein HG530_000633 [Fusarium avenaceum]|nr:hypothetical protein HG530_000633 [Fusarium avenaceum]
MLEFSPCQNGHENGADTYGSEMASEQGLAPCFDVRYKWFQGKHDRNSAEEEDKNGYDHKSPSLHAKDIVVELLPWDDRSKVDEISQVKQKIDNVGHVRLFSLFAKPTIVGETDSGSETDEQIVQAKDTTRASAPERNNEVEDKETLSIDKVTLFGELDTMAGNVANDEAINSTKNTLVKEDIYNEVEAHILDISLMLRNSLCKLSLSDNGGGQDRISSSNTGSHNKTVKPVQRRDHPENEQTCNEPAKCHDWDQEKDDGFPMALHVELGQFDTNGETLYNKNDSGEFDGDDIGRAP